MLVEAFLCLVALLCLYFALRKPPALPPGVWGVPVFGKFPSLSKRFGEQVKELRPRYGDIITWRCGSRVMVFLCNYAIIKRALSSKEFQDRPDYAAFLAYGRGEQRGVILGNGSKWLLHRRFMLHHLRNLGMGKSKAEDAIHEEAALMVADFKKHTNEDKPLPMSLAVAVLNVIWKMVADTRFEPDDPNPQLHSPALGDEPDHPGRPGDVVQPSAVAGGLRTGLGEAEEGSSETAGVSYESERFCQVEDLYTLTLDLLDAGLETTTSTMRWAILYLTKFPEVQRRVQREIDDVVPRGTLPLYKDKAKLPYFEAVLSEVHRVVSLLPLALPHQASVYTQLEGYAIPKGTILFPHLECCHKDPELWERPDEFYPEHFLDADGKYVTREGLMPFSVGRRACVGESLARVELYVFLVALLQSFSFSAPEGEELSTENDPAELILNACKEYRVTIKERQ